MLRQQHQIPVSEQHIHTNAHSDTKSQEYQKWLLSMSHHQQQQQNNNTNNKYENMFNGHKSDNYFQSASAMPAQYQQQIHPQFQPKPSNKASNPHPQAAASSKMSEVEKIKQELLGYQREIELMQKQREYAKLMKQQKQQQLELEKLKTECNKIITPMQEAQSTHRDSIDTMKTDEELEELKRFERTSKQVSNQNEQKNFHPDTLLASHNTHYQNHQYIDEQTLDQYCKPNQIHEHAIHSKPLNYNCN